VEKEKLDHYSGVIIDLNSKILFAGYSKRPERNVRAILWKFLVCLRGCLGVTKEVARVVEVL
jgi:hypothetical protein